MNYIGLDVSKISTAMCIESNNINYLFSYNTNKPNYKWNKSIESIHNVKVKTYEYDNTIEDYSEKEINKLSIFLQIANDIIGDINSVINKNEKTIIYFEGYSYGKDPGPIIDLVGIGSIVRAKLYENIPLLKEIKIIAPKSLKTITAEMVYGFDVVEKGKRVIKTVKEIRTNKKGVKGGDFTKHDMFHAILDYDNEYNLDNFFMRNYDEINELKTFPKPIEDLDDAWLLKEIIKYSEIKDNI